MIKLVFVHKYKVSHADKRKKYKSLLKRKRVKIFRKTTVGWFYEISPVEAIK